MDDTQTIILDTICEHMQLDAAARERLAASGRLDELTAVDSLLTVDLVLSLEERFGLRFPPEDIQAELISDIAKLSAYLDRARNGG